ncbi:unnamed protein product, partial [Didymodactylos carnosus]
GHFSIMDITNKPSSSSLVDPYQEALNALCELYDQLNEEDYYIGLWLNRCSSSSNKTLSDGLLYEQIGHFKQAYDCYTQSIKNIESSNQISPDLTSRLCQLDEYSLLEKHWIQCTKELNQWDTLLTYCKNNSPNKTSGDNTNYLLLADCSWKLGNWQLMKETLNHIDSISNGGGTTTTNGTTNTTPSTTTNTITNGTSLYNLPQLMIRDFQWKMLLYRGYLTLCSPDDTSHHNTMTITERLVEYCTQLAIKEWKHLPFIVSNAHLTLLQASQRIIELQEAGQVLLNLQSTVNLSSASSTQSSSVTGSTVSATPTTTTGTSSNANNGIGAASTTANIRNANIHELKAIVKIWKSRLPLLNDNLSYWNDVLSWREFHYSTISLQFEKETTSNHAMIGVHAIAQSIIQLARIARKQNMPNVCLDILSRIGTTIPNVPVVDTFQKMKQLIKCYLKLFPTMSTTDVQECSDLIDSTNLKYFNKDMISEYLCLKGQTYETCLRTDDANKMYSSSTQMCDTLARSWIQWGDFLMKQQPTNISLIENSILCYLHACKDQIESKARKHIAKILWLLTYDDNKSTLSTCIQRYSTGIPAPHWLIWIPQLLEQVKRNENTCACDLLTELIRVYPQAVYIKLRAYLIEQQAKYDHTTQTTVQ